MRFHFHSFFLLFFFSHTGFYFTLPPVLRFCSHSSGQKIKAQKEESQEVSEPELKTRTVWPKATQPWARCLLGIQQEAILTTDLSPESWQLPHFNEGER